MTENIHGTLTLPDNIDITDPCYGEDVWCRINNFPIPAGTYECYTITADDSETRGWGDRIARIGIRTEKADTYERKGMIGVDSGMAGFFNCDNRLIYDEILHESIEDVYVFENAFLSSSGYGDGAYDIFAGYKNGKLTEVYIDFLGDLDEDEKEC